MDLFDLDKLAEFNNEKFSVKVLVKDAKQRLLLFCLRTGQAVPEHAAPGTVTVQCVSGRVTFYDGEEPCNLPAGTLVRLEPQRPHSLKADEDSVLLVSIVS